MYGSEHSSSDSGSNSSQHPTGLHQTGARSAFRSSFTSRNRFNAVRARSLDAISMTWKQVDEFRAAARAACGYDQLRELKLENGTAYNCTRQ